MLSRFPSIVVHILTQSIVTNENRDQYGSPKGATFNGVSRRRKSSQCIKAHLSKQLRSKMSELMAIRSRHIVERKVAAVFASEIGIKVDDNGKPIPQGLPKEFNELAFQFVLNGCQSLLMGKKVDKKAAKELEALMTQRNSHRKKKNDKEAKATKDGAEPGLSKEMIDYLKYDLAVYLKGGAAETEDIESNNEAREAFEKDEKLSIDKDADRKTPITLSIPRINALGKVATIVYKDILDGKKNDLQSMAQAFSNVVNKQADGLFTLSNVQVPCGIDVALMGDMALASCIDRTTSSLSVSHQLSVHKMERETDFFTVMDQLTSQSKGEGAVGHINENEFASDLAYGTFILDMDVFIRNLGGESPENLELARKVIKEVIFFAGVQKHAAKKGATAPFSLASALLVEVGGYGCTLGGAFTEPLPLEGDDLESRTHERLAQKVKEQDEAFPFHGVRSVLTKNPHSALRTLKANVCNIEELATWTAEMATNVVSIDEAKARLEKSAVTTTKNGNSPKSRLA